MAPSASDGLSTKEFARQFNYHIASAFITTIGLCVSLSYIFKSCLLQSMLLKAIRLYHLYNTHRLKSNVNAKEDGSYQHETMKQEILRGHHTIPAFALTLLVFLSFLAQLFSSLTFKVVGGYALCAFLITLNNMSLQSARLVGLFILGSDLRAQKFGRSEILIYWLALAAATVLTVVSAVLSSGLLRPVNTGFFLCYRQPSLPTSLTLSVTVLLIEVYYTIRTFYIIILYSAPRSRKWDVLRNIRSIKFVSLIVFDILIIVPSGIPVSFLGQSIPQSIASLIVTIIFNIRQNTQEMTSDVPRYPDLEVQYPGKSSIKPAGDPRKLWSDLYIPKHPFSASALGNSSVYTIEGLAMDIPSLTTNTSRIDLSRQRVDTSNISSSSIAMLPYSAPVKYSRKSKSMLRLLKRQSRQVASEVIEERESSLLIDRSIIPKSELARQFNNSEQTPLGSLYPSPSYAHKSNARDCLRGHSHPATRSRSSLTLSIPETSYSVYGSDIIRPTKGQKDRTRATQNANITELGSGVVRMSTGSMSSKNDRKHSLSWDISDVVSAINISRASTVISIRNWPRPPSTIPARMPSPSRIPYWRTTKHRELITNPQPESITDSINEMAVI